MNWQDIVRMEGNRNYTLFVLADGRHYMSSRSLCTFEGRLPAGFVRIHKGCIVHLAFVKGIERYEKLLLLTDGTYLQVARRRWVAVLDLVLNTLP